MRKVDGLCLIFIEFYAPAPTPRLNSTETSPSTVGRHGETLGEDSQRAPEEDRFDAPERLRQEVTRLPAGL
jgi:hypothetical protein